MQDRTVLAFCGLVYLCAQPQQQVLRDEKPIFCAWFLCQGHTLQRFPSGQVRADNDALRRETLPLRPPRQTVRALRLEKRQHVLTTWSVTPVERRLPSLGCPCRRARLLRHSVEEVRRELSLLCVAHCSSGGPYLPSDSRQYAE